MHGSRRPLSSPSDRLGDHGARGPKTASKGVKTPHFHPVLVRFLPDSPSIHPHFTRGFVRPFAWPSARRRAEAREFRRARPAVRLVDGVKRNRLFGEGFGPKSGSGEGTGGRGEDEFSREWFRERRITGSRDCGRGPPRRAETGGKKAHSGHSGGPKSTPAGSEIRPRTLADSLNAPPTGAVFAAPVLVVRVSAPCRRGS
jgi:hypothetical protein